MKLYIRPMLLGTGQQLGLYPSPEISFVVFVSPTGNYFGKGAPGLNLHIETKRCRAARGGMGAVKCSGNYAAAMRPLLDCKQGGFDDNLYLELESFDDESKIEEAVLQELSAANIFLVLKSGEIVTPSLDRGTILPGVTRASILELIDQHADELQPVVAKATNNSSPDMKVVASSREVRVAELRQAVEVFATGTAAEVVPIASCQADNGWRATFEESDGSVTAKILSLLRQAMVDETTGWLRDPLNDEHWE